MLAPALLPLEVAFLDGFALPFGPMAGLLVTAGGRADLDVTMPADSSPVRVHLGGSAAVVLGSRSHCSGTTGERRSR